MGLFEKALEAEVMSTHILIRADVSKNLLLKAYAMAKEFEHRYSAYKSESFLNEINNSAGIKRVECQAEDMALFKSSLEASKMSGGEFDITMGALSHGAYHFGFSNQKVADKKSIEKQKELVDYRLIELDENSIYLPKKGMRIDLGGIGKGYCAKKIALYLKESGAKKALVDVGGEIVSFGKSYTVAVKDPFLKTNLAYIKTSKEPISISTSGDYERFIDSRENHHILNKESGGSPSLYSSMSVLQNGFGIDMLDAYATAMFNKDEEYVRSFSKEIGFATISIDKDSNISFNNIKDLKLKSIELLK